LLNVTLDQEELMNLDRVNGIMD